MKQPGRVAGTRFKSPVGAERKYDSSVIQQSTHDLDGTDTGGSHRIVDRRIQERGTVNLSNPRAIFAGSPSRFTRSRVTYEAYVVSGTSTRPQVDSAVFRPDFDVVFTPIRLCANMVGMGEFRLPDGRKVRITERALENIDDHDDCPFCLGQAAAHRGDAEECNPFPEVDVRRGSDEWYESDYGLWLTGHSLGSTEPGGLLWYEQPNRGGEDRN